MPSHYTFDVHQMVHFQGDRFCFRMDALMVKNTMVGLLTSLRLAEVDLYKDIVPVGIPFAEKGPDKVAGVLDSLSLGDGAGDAIRLGTYISAANYRRVSTALNERPVASISVALDFTIWTYSVEGEAEGEGRAQFVEVLRPRQQLNGSIEVQPVLQEPPTYRNPHAHMSLSIIPKSAD